MSIRDRSASVLSAITAVLALLACLLPVPTQHITYAMSALRVPTVPVPALYRHTSPVRLVTVLYYTVQPGDSLSSIARKQYGRADAWPLLFYANKRQIRWANDIYPRQRFIVPALTGAIPAVPSSELSPAAPTDPPVHIQVAAASSGTYGHPYYCGDGDRDGWDRPCSTPHASSAQARGYAAPVASSSYSVGSSFRACVIQRESGGDSQIWNASGHYGLYQFSASTWAAHGGNPADFGHASAAEQTQVFLNTVAADGTSDWAPYDGC